MPLYEYHCRTCNETFTRLRPMGTAGIDSECSRGHQANQTITIAVQARGGADEEPELGLSGCACGQGVCGCSSLN